MFCESERVYWVGRTAKQIDFALRWFIAALVPQFLVLLVGLQLPPESEEQEKAEAVGTVRRQRSQWVLCLTVLQCPGVGGRNGNGRG